MPMSASKRPSLRAKKGCNRCRAFRKKCDEGKPSCSRCVRAETACTWPASHELKDARFRKAVRTSQNVMDQPRSRSRCYDADEICSIDSPLSEATCLSPLLSSPRISTTITTESDHSLFQYFVNVYFTKQLLPKAYSQFQNMTLHVGRLALHDSPMLQVALACAALHIHQTAGTPELHKMALSYYGRSMSHLARELARSKTLSKDEMDSIGFTMTFMYIFAASSDDCYDDVSYHVAAAQRYIRRRYLENPHCRYRHLRTADRALLESVLYQTFDLAVKGHTSPGPCADLAFFTATTQALTSGHDESESLQCVDKSPVLGMPLDLYHLAFRIAQLRDESMSQLDPGGLRERAKSLLAEIHHWEPRIANSHDNSSTTQHQRGDIYNQITLLYVFAASVLLRQVIATSLMDNTSGVLQSEWQAVIETHLTQAAQLVSSMDKADPSANCYLGTWALQVLSNACHPDDETRSVFKNELLRRHSVMKSGDIRRALSLLDTKI